MLLIISKLPHDLKDVMHILPPWFSYVYWFLWIVGMALILCLGILLIAKIIKYLQELPVGHKFSLKPKKIRLYPRDQLMRDLNLIHSETVESKLFRLGLHRMSSVIKTYFEILLHKEIEEMTATEITSNVKEKKDLGIFAKKLTVSQFQPEEPSAEVFETHYEEAKKLLAPTYGV